LVLANSSLEFKQKLPDGYICIGYISGFWKVHGEAKLFLFNRETSLLNHWMSVELWDGKHRVEVRIKMKTGSGKRVIASIDGYTSKEQLVKVLDWKILIHEKQLPKLTDLEFYHHQLLGLTVFDGNDVSYGRVIEIVSGNVDIFVVQHGQNLHYIPFVSEQVLSIDLEKGILIPSRDDNEG
jgi:16S rRNA processing protein RimM